jgi:hypothetical protein
MLGLIQWVSRALSPGINWLVCESVGARNYRVFFSVDHTLQVVNKVGDFEPEDSSLWLEKSSVRC